MSASHLFPQHWAITPRALTHLWRRWQNGEAETADPQSPAEPKPAGRRGAVAVIDIKGALAKDADWFGPGMRDIAAQVDTAAGDEKVRAIVLNIDSPGGTVDGTKELADRVKKAAEAKPVVAYNDGLMASAAYWIASQATKIISAEMSEVGSIGTLMMHTDFAVALEREGIHVEILRATGSPDKAKPNPVEEMDDDTRAEVTAVLDEYNAAFHAAVLAGRPQVPAEAMTGKLYTAESAPTGLIDQQGSISTAIEVARILGATHAVETERAASTKPQLTQPEINMSDLIKNVKAIYADSDFLADAVMMAADDKTEGEIATAYAKRIESGLAAAKAEHAAELAAVREEASAGLAEVTKLHESALAEQMETSDVAIEALKAEVAAAETRANDAEAKLKSGGFRAAEAGDASSKTSGYTLTKI